MRKSMSMRFGRAAAAQVLGLALAAAPSGAAAGEMAKQKLSEKPIDVLGGRLKVRVPGDAKIRPRGHGIMAAPVSPEEETRVFLEAGEEKLVLMVNETFQTAGDDFGRRIEAELNDPGADPPAFKVEAFELQSPASRDLPCFIVVPTDMRARGDAVLLRLAFLGLKDKTVLTLGVYVNPKAFEDRPACERLAAEILASAEPGPKKLEISGGKRSLGGLEVTVPENWVLTAQDGPDFTVWHFVVLSPFGSQQKTLSLYRGEHPSWAHDQAFRGRSDAPPVSMADGTFLGQKTSWHSWSVGEGEDVRRHCEAMIQDPAGGEFPLAFHVFMSAGDELGLAEMRAVAEKMVAEKPKAQAPQPEGPR